MIKWPKQMCDVQPSHSKKCSHLIEESNDLGIFMLRDSILQNFSKGQLRLLKIQHICTLLLFCFMMEVVQVRIYKWKSWYNLTFNNTSYNGDGGKHSWW